METRRWRLREGKVGDYSKQFSNDLQNHHGRRVLGGSLQTCVQVSAAGRVLRHGSLKCIQNLFWGEFQLSHKYSHPSVHSEAGMEFFLIRPLLPQRHVKPNQHPPQLKCLLRHMDALSTGMPDTCQKPTCQPAFIQSLAKRDNNGRFALQEAQCILFSVY